MHLFILGISLETDSHSAARDYANIPGTQIYLFDKSNAFSYISIDATSSTKLKATVYLYVTTQLSNISNGVYTSIGFGTNRMSGADIMLCAVTNSGNQWCKDYKGLSSDISESTSITSLVSSKVNNLGSSWYPYVTQIIWQIERQMNPISYINGSGSAIYAYGSLNSSGFPQRHSNGYYSSIRTGDGNTGNPPQGNQNADTSTTTNTGSTTGTTTGSTTTTPATTYPKDESKHEEDEDNDDDRDGEKSHEVEDDDEDNKSNMSTETNVGESPKSTANTTPTNQYQTTSTTQENTSITTTPTKDSASTTSPQTNTTTSKQNLLENTTAQANASVTVDNSATFTNLKAHFMKVQLPLLVLALVFLP